MLYAKILVITFAFILFIRWLKIARPSLDLIKSGHRYVLLFWYWKDDGWGEYKRTFIKLIG